MKIEKHRLSNSTNGTVLKCFPFARKKQLIITSPANYLNEV